MELSNRLKTVASFVRTSRRIADIGTDHGYIPIYLYKEGKIDWAAACDINKEPVKRAEINVSMSNLMDKIDTRLGSGLRPVNKGEVEGIVIAGMGGMLMIDILSENPEKTDALCELVLQPQTDIDKVRKYIHSIGFRIDDEKMLFEEGIYYTVIRAVHGEEKYDSEAEYEFGRINIERKCPVLKEYIEKIIEKNENVMAKLKEAGSENSVKRLAELSEYNTMCEEVYKCL